jgi:hypothetical protein
MFQTRLPEDERSGLKHAVRRCKNYNISLTNVHFVRSYYTITLRCYVQNTTSAYIVLCPVTFKPYINCFHHTQK